MGEVRLSLTLTCDAFRRGERQGVPVSEPAVRPLAVREHGSLCCEHGRVLTATGDLDDLMIVR